VSVSYHSKRGAESIIPKPVIDALQHPSKITSVLYGKQVSVAAGVLNNDEGDKDE
jgi:hypothetical protein